MGGTLQTARCRGHIPPQSGALSSMPGTTQRLETVCTGSILPSSTLPVSAAHFLSSTQVLNLGSSAPLSACSPVGR